MAKTVYLDYAAATPMDPAVLAAMRPYFTDKFYNPSATYLAAKAVADDIEAARVKVAGWLGARPSEIIFTAGGTEANNLALQGIMDSHPTGNVVISAIEHDSVINPAKAYNHKLVKVLASGQLDLEDLVKKIDSQTVLVSVMYANNEIGTIMPIRQISQLLRGIKKQRIASGNKMPLYFHTDACQAASYVDLHVSRLGVDLMSVNGGKIYGPKQSGFLYIKTGSAVKPQILGGGQENGLRSGTENVVAIVGLAEALDLVQARRQGESKRLSQLQNLFISSLGKEIPSATVNGDLKNRLPSNVHITVDGQDNERLMMMLDEKGIICAVGSACAASSDKPSHVLRAIGLSDKQAESSLRFSFGKLTTKADIKRSITELKRCLNSLA